MCNSLPQGNYYPDTDERSHCGQQGFAFRLLAIAQTNISTTILASFKNISWQALKSSQQYQQTFVWSLNTADVLLKSFAVLL